MQMVKVYALVVLILIQILEHNLLISVKIQKSVTVMQMDNIHVHVEVVVICAVIAVVEIVQNYVDLILLVQPQHLLHLQILLQPNPPHHNQELMD